MGYTVEFHIVRKSQSYTKWADEQLILDSFLVHRERERDREISRNILEVLLISVYISAFKIDNNGV